MKRFITFSLFAIGLTAVQAQKTTFAATPQDKGLPYTQTAFERGTGSIKGMIALYSGSRYGYIDGKRVRLDSGDLLHGWSYRKGDKLFVPVAFAGALTVKRPEFSTVPKDLELLANRWVYEMKVPKVKIPAGVEVVNRKGKELFDVVAYAKMLGKEVITTEKGVVLIADSPIRYNEKANPYSEAVVALFDTPEKYADPDLSIRYIPNLKDKGDVRLHARITPEQWKELEQGEELETQPVDRSTYNFDGFNTQLLGTTPPAPGIYPRILFSERDLPMLKAHIAANRSAQKSMIEMEVLFQKTWLNPSSSDGEIFKLLEEGRLDEIRSRQELPKEGAAVYHVGKLTSDHKPGIYQSHINYVTNCLTTMSLYALLTENDTLGKRAATALCNYFRLIEPLVEKHLKTSDSEFGISFDGGNHATTHWRGMHGVVPHMDLAFALDFGGKWMDSKQKKFMQNLIAKATYGRRTGGGDAPRHLWRDINHMTWHLTHLLCLTAIEGLPGFDTEGYASGEELTRDFLDFGIDRNGQIFESNGKSGGGIQFQILSMIALARRGNNLWGHPHFRKLAEAQVYTTSPNGQETVSSGTWGGSPFVGQTLCEMKAFFPNDKNIDYLLSKAFPETGDWKSYNLNTLRASLEKKTHGVRLPGPTYPGFGMSFPYIADWQTLKSKEGVQSSLDWNSDVYGIFSTSSNLISDASWLCLHVRDNHYIGSGHHHSDIGMFYYSALGVNWITESPFPKNYNGKYHNLVLIDGVSESDETPAKGSYQGAKMTSQSAIASADLSYAYSWKWCTQVFDWGKGFSSLATPYNDHVWELETKPEVFNLFKGGSNYKVRIWWATSNQANFIPTLRAPWNPVEYAYRSAGLVKGTSPLGIVVDDLKKDRHSHLYQWTAMAGKGVWKADVQGLPANCVALGYDPSSITFPLKETLSTIKPRKGDPILLVYALGMKAPDVLGMENFIRTEIATDGPDEGKGVQRYIRIVIDQVSKAVNYRVLLVPYCYGDVLPTVIYENNRATITQNGTTQRMRFEVDKKEQTQVVEE